MATSIDWVKKGKRGPKRAEHRERRFRSRRGRSGSGEKRRRKRVGRLVPMGERRERQQDVSQCFHVAISPLEEAKKKEKRVNKDFRREIVEVNAFRKSYV